MYQNGTTLPNWIIQQSRLPALTVYTTDIEDLDEYPIRITAILDNLYNWFESDDQYSVDYVNDPDNYKRWYDPDYPPDWLIFT